jgi:hypothetical protein
VTWERLYPKEGHIVLWENEVDDLTRKLKKFEGKAQDSSSNCRKINLLMQTCQNSWKYLEQIKHQQRLYHDISQTINKKQEAATFIGFQRGLNDESDDSEYCGLNTILGHIPHKEMHEMQMEEANAQLSKSSRFLNKLEEQRNKFLQARKEAEMEYFKQLEQQRQRFQGPADNQLSPRKEAEIKSDEQTDQFQCFQRTAENLPFPTGPVGDSPIHDCFLLGLMDIGKKLIEKYYSSPELLSVSYKNDLDPWRKELDRQKSTSQLCQTGEDGLYTGETVLHIAIVQANSEMVQYLLEQGIEISSRATGVFFQPKYLRPLSVELTTWQTFKAWIIGIDLKREKFAAVLKRENKDSGTYFGEYPLSFAASIGNVEICNLLYYYKQLRIQSCMDFESKKTVKDVCKMPKSEKKEFDMSILGKSRSWLERGQSIARMNPHLSKDFQWESDQGSEKQLMWEFVNATDNLGNTALHLAVWHRRKDTIDWILSKREGRHGLNVLNHDAFTPLTLAARRGHVDIFHHILYKNMSKTGWVYGKVSFMLIFAL